MPLLDWPRRIADTEAALVDFLNDVFALYLTPQVLGDMRGKCHSYGGQFERAIQSLTPVLPTILVRYFGSDFDSMDEHLDIVNRTAHFEFFYVFHSARGEDEARLGCTRVMEYVVQRLGGKSFEGLTDVFVPVSEEFFFAEGGLVVYRQAWRTEWKEE